MPRSAEIPNVNWTGEEEAFWDRAVQTDAGEPSVKPAGLCGCVPPVTLCTSPPLPDPQMWLSEMLLSATLWAWSHTHSLVLSLCLQFWRRGYSDFWLDSFHHSFQYLQDCVCWYWLNSHWTESKRKACIITLCFGKIISTISSFPSISFIHLSHLIQMISHVLLKQKWEWFQISTSPSYSCTNRWGLRAVDLTPLS